MKLATKDLDHSHRTQHQSSHPTPRHIALEEEIYAQADRQLARSLSAILLSFVLSGIATLGCELNDQHPETGAGSCEGQACGAPDTLQLSAVQGDQERGGDAIDEDEDDDPCLGVEGEEREVDEGEREEVEEGEREEEDRDEVGESRGRLLAIGDSVLDWNRDEGASIPAIVGQRAQLEVINESISGSQVLDPSDEGIPQQYISGDWNWVLIDGGANDVGDGCGCGECMGQVNRIISPDASEGAMVSLVSRAVGDGAHVVLLGYYQVSGPDFDGCEDEAEAINARYQALAERSPEVIFVNMSDAVSNEPMNVYLDEDGIHPSIYGGELIGELIAQRIMEHEVR